MRPVTRFRSQLLFRKSYKLQRVLRFRPAKKAAFGVRPVWANVSQKVYEFASD